MVGIESDTRIIIANGIAKMFETLVRDRRIPLTINREKILTRLSEVNSKLMALKWSYKPLEQILQSKELRDIEIMFKEIFDSFPDNWANMLESRGIEGKMTVGTLLFIRDFFYTLREKLKNGFSDDYADCIDILCGEILSIDSVSKGIWKCLVTDGKARYNVITNIEGIKKGEVVPIAKLPPQVIHGVYSEGMFVGSSKGLQRFTKDDVGKRPELSDKELGQTRGILEREFASKK